jgi:hypothetical protein
MRGALMVVVTGLVICAPAAAQAEGEAETTGAGTPTTVETTRVEALPPAPTPALEHIPLIDERTAYMVGRHTLKLGILAFEYGIVERLSIGSDPPSWLLRAFISVWVPNLHVKYQIFDQGPVAVAAKAAGYFATTDSENISGHVIDVPLSLFVSVKVHPRITLHAEGTYVYARIFGTGDVTRLQLNGATASRTAQVGLMAQFRLTRIFSLTATGRFQAYTADLPLGGDSTIDPNTTATLNGQLVPAVQHPWQVIGGIAVLWRYFHLILGAGYGNYFVPGLDVADPKRSVVPDASLSVVL